MDTLSFQRLETLFETAIALDVTGRTSLLQGLRAESAQIASRLEAMLRRSGPECEDAIQRATEAVREDLPESRLQQIGRYRLLWTLGEGGFGIVYLAEQPAPAHRLLALKVIKPGMDTKAVLARFDDERQAMAKMDHPAVVTAIDAGTTDEGRPFVVMPLVPGPPITAYCIEQNLSIAERVSLMAQVTRGVQHTHARGVMHRDLKPGNILVAFADGTAQPRIIDFGLAKALGRPLTAHATLTQEGRPVGTPEYMSPEQARGGIADARSDVYSLGAILYELLTGKPPIEPATIRAKGESAIGDVISDAHVPPPSARTTERVPRELDWIALRCLEKEPDRRYPTAEALAADLERFVGGQRVAAGPPARMYRLWRWLSRHRGVAVSLVVACSAVVIAAAASVVFGMKEQTARRHAEQFSGIARKVLTGLDPEIAQGHDRSLMLRMLDRVEADYRGQYLDDEVGADFETLLAESFYTIGEYARALPYAERGNELATGIWGPASTQAVESMRILLEVRLSTGGPEGQERWSQDAKEMLRAARSLYPFGSRERIRATLTACRFNVTPSVRESRLLLADLQKESEANLGPSDRLTLRVMRVRAKDNEPAVEMLVLLREARRRAESTYGPSDPDVDAGLALESYYVGNVENEKAALALLRERLPVAEASLGSFHTAVQAGTYNFGCLLLSHEGPEAAEPHVRRGVDLAVRKHGPESDWASWADSSLLLWCLRANRLNEAESVMSRFVDRWRVLQSQGLNSNVPADEKLLQDIVIELDKAGHTQASDLLVRLVRECKPGFADTIEAARAAPKNSEPQAP